MSADAELEAEQAYIHHGYAALDRMHARTSKLLEEAPNDPDLIASLTRRVTQLTDNGRALCFGRIDTEAGECWHIGRRHVEDQDAEPVVVEWRAPIAVPFYRAKITDPRGLVRRRQFVVDGRTLLSMADDFFTEEAASQADGPHVRGRDALLAELERGRTGQMLDIVATIQAEQDEIIRAPIEGILTVQGGPGSGKTAIGLHRAAYLLFGNDVLARAGVLVVGPNRTFLRYIAQVLPSLGEEAVVQTTLTDLVPDAPVRAEDELATQRLKGDARLATVLRRALQNRRRLLTEGFEVRHRSTRVRVEADEANQLASTVAARRVPYAAGRTALRDLLARAVYDRYTQRSGSVAADYVEISRSLQGSASFKAALDVLWPSVSAPALVRELLGSATRLSEAAGDLLHAHEQASLVRKSARSLKAERWTEADGPLVDEAIELIEGRVRTYGHAVVDEAQDLSPMQARMLGRRCPNGSMTLLGDIAQGTGPWGRNEWEDLLAHLPAPDGARIAELRLGYRAPGQVLDLASRLLPSIAPGLRPTESIRPGRFAPSIRRVTADVLAASAAAEAAALSGHHGSVAVIVPGALHDEVRSALADTSLDTGDASANGLDHRVTVVAALASKGLEFEAVVVVEPALIRLDAPHGLRLVYICLTRPTQHLSVVHAEALPTELVA